MESGGTVQFGKIPRRQWKKPTEGERERLKNFEALLRASLSPKLPRQPE